MKTFQGSLSISAKIGSSIVAIDSKVQNGYLIALKNQSGDYVTEFEVVTIPSNALLDYDGNPVLDSDGGYILID